MSASLVGSEMCIRDSPMPLGTSGLAGNFLMPSELRDVAKARCSRRERAPRSSWASYSLTTAS
eukprot:14471539-Alexandrium_andersonii.AAC.1